MVPSCAHLKGQLAWVQVFSNHFNTVLLSQLCLGIQNLSVAKKNRYYFNNDGSLLYFSYISLQDAAVENVL